MSKATKLIIVLLLVSISAVFSMLWFSSQITRPITFKQQVLFEVKSGDSATGVLRRLYRLAQDPPNAYASRMWLKFLSSNHTVQKGVYEFDSGVTLADIFAKLARGEQKQFTVTLIEGHTWQQWLTRLKQAPYLLDDWQPEIEARLKNQSTLIDSEQATSWEGMLLAETYAYTANTPISQIVARAHQALIDELKLHTALRPLPSMLNSYYEVLVLASIVEKETAQANERPIIAGVFQNRLAQNMRLQTDPTVIYGLGNEFDGDITREHLRRPTAYNTYVIKGLPPTPIAMVGKEAISAVFAAAPTDYLYFVSRGDGTHQFSTNLQDHNRAVKEYQLGQ